MVKVGKYLDANFRKLVHWERSETEFFWKNSVSIDLTLRFKRRTIVHIWSHHVGCRGNCLNQFLNPQSAIRNSARPLTTRLLTGYVIAHLRIWHNDQMMGFPIGHHDVMPIGLPDATILWSICNLQFRINNELRNQRMKRKKPPGLNSFFSEFVVQFAISFLWLEGGISPCLTPDK